MRVSSHRASPGQVLGAAGVVALLVWAGLATPVFFGQLLGTCPASLCTRFEQPTPETLAVLRAIGLSPAGYAVIVTVTAWLGFLVLTAVSVVLLKSGRLQGPLGPVTAVLMTGTGLAPFTQALASESTTGRGLDVVRATAVAACAPVFVGLFPSGSWYPGWFRRWWPLFSGIEVVQVVGYAVGGRSFDEATLAPLPGALLMVLYVTVQIRRFRRASDWVARQQAKWVIGALLLIALNAIGAAVAIALDVIAAYQLVAVVTTYVAFGTLGVALALGLLRYRLYEVDLVLRRTAVYTLALVVLAVSYLGLVAAANALTTRVAGPALAAVGVAVLAFVGGIVAYLLRERIRRRLLGGHGLAAAVAALARAGARSSPGADVAGTIAAGLGLPYVAVLGAAGQTLWTHGRPDRATVSESVVDDTGTRVGTLLLGAPRGADRLDRHHRRVLAEVLPFVVLVLRARAEADELRAARTAAATAREDERRRLRRDLHDGVGPLLAGQLLALDTMRVTGNRPELLAHLEAQTRSAIGEVRRVAHDLRPALLDAGGLPAALDSEAERLRVAGLPVRLGVDLSGVTLPAAAEVAVLRIAQEALANVVRHADASTAQVTVVVADGGLELVVADDGRGRGANPDGVGSVSMVERTQELGGTVTTEPGPHGGTVVRARIPLPLPAAGPA